MKDSNTEGPLQVFGNNYSNEYSGSTPSEMYLNIVSLNRFPFTAVSRKVVLQKRKSARDNVERYCG